MKLAEHPTVKRIRRQESSIDEESGEPLDADWLRQLVLDAGADDDLRSSLHQPRDT